MNFQEADKFIFFYNFNLNTFPSFENECLEMGLNMTKLSSYFQKDRFSPYIENVKILGPERCFKATRKIKLGLYFSSQ